MNLVTQVFAMVAAAFGVVAFVLESFLFHRPSVQTFLLGKPEPAAGVRFWAFNQGFYNLFLAAGPVAGLIAYYAGHEDVGRALVIYGCAFMAACGVVLFISDRRLWRSMIKAERPTTYRAHCGARLAFPEPRGNRLPQRGEGETRPRSPRSWDSRLMSKTARSAA